jgi:hypothetical protein
MKGRNDLGDLIMDARIILRSTLSKYKVREWTLFVWLAIASGGEMKMNLQVARKAGVC